MDGLRRGRPVLGVGIVPTALITVMEVALVRLVLAGRA